jgi:cytochrome c-type biogenesis protein CcmE
MAEIQWEKHDGLLGTRPVKRDHRWKFLVVGVAILAAIAYLLISTGGGRYYVTVDELMNDSNMIDKNVRVSGAVLGDPVFDQDAQTLTFTVVNIPNDNDEIRDQGGLAEVLHNAVENPNAIRMVVVAHDKEIPDLLKNEAQAIMSGKLRKDDNGVGAYVFYADEIMLKCPTRYEEDVPEQVKQ